MDSPTAARPGLTLPGLVLLTYYFAVPWSDAVDAVPLTRVLGVMIAALAGLMVVRNRGIYLTTFHKWLLLFCAWALMTVAWSIDTRSSWIVLFGIAKGALLVFATWQVTRDPQDYEAFAAAFIFGFLVAMAPTLLGYVGLLREFGEGITGTHYWRFAGVGTDANHFSVSLAVCIPVAIWLALRTGSLARKSAYLAFILVAWYAVLLSASRTGFVCALFATGAAVYSERGRGRWVPIAAGAGVLVLLAGGALLLPEAALKRVLSVGTEIQRGDLSGRGEIWQVGFGVFLDNVFAGAGIGAFETAVAPHFYRAFSAHNTPLAIAAETGIVGLALFSLAVWAHWRWLGRSGDYPWRVGLITLLLGSLTLTFQVTQIFWALLALLFGCAAARSAAHESARADRPLWQGPESVKIGPRGAPHQADIGGIRSHEK